LSSEERLDEIRFALITCYSVVEGILLPVSLSMWYITEIDRTKTIMDLGPLVMFGCMISVLLYWFFNGLVIEELFNAEDGARLAFVQTFITTIFALSLVQAPAVFYMVCLYWCGISPIGILLSAGAYLVPYIRNRIVNIIIGAISTAIGFASKFYPLPLIEPINTILTAGGALLTVIGIGAPKDKTS
jgi:hypothetical protein